MANLATLKINTSGQYVSLASLLDSALELGIEYILQPLNCAIFIREGLVGNGFYIAEKEKACFTLQNANTPLYIKTDTSDFAEAVVNVHKNTV